MKRRLAAAAITTAIVGFAAVGCSSSASSKSTASTDPASVSGTVTWWDTSDATNEAPNYKSLITQFEAKYPKIKVNYVNVPFSQAENKFKTAAQSGSGAPDVLRADVGWTPTFASLGYLQPLDGTPALADDSDYMAGAYGSDHYNGKIYGVPEVTDTLALLYNKEIFAKAGIATPPKTWDEAKTDAATIEQKVPGTTGIFVNADSYFLLPFVYAQGGNYIDASSKKITLNSPQMATAIGVAQGLAAKGVGTTDTSSNGYTNMQNAFKTGKAAMVVNGPWSTADDLSGSAFTDKSNLGVAAVPAGPGGQGGPTGGHNLVVYAGSKNLNPSYLFIAFMNSAANQAFIASKNNTLPTRTSAYSMPEVTGNPLLSAFQEPLKVSQARWPVAGASDVFGVVTPDYQKILGGQESVSAGLTNMQKQATQTLTGFTG
jgi:arabinogalactan oligomer / maltooligosaccharide transport system substrate-binding protein